MTPPSKLASLAYIEPQQQSMVKQLLREGNYEKALVAAKSYYNVVGLSKTEDAVKLMAEVLTKARGKTIGTAFCKVQLNDTMPIAEIIAPVIGNRVLQSIRIDSSVYDQAIEKLRDNSYSISAQLGCGNLLLLSDRPAEARMCFELALQLVAKSNNGKMSESVRSREAMRGWDGIARTIRDENDSALPADVFVRTIRARAMAQATAVGGTGLVMPEPIRDGANKLMESGIFKDDPGLASFQSPEDPCAKAANDPRLSSWLSKWQSNKDDDAMLRDHRIELQQILGKSNLPCLTLVGIGRAISFQSKDDWTESALYATAALHGHTELAAYPIGASKTRPIIDALNSVQSRLWKITDEGDLTFAEAQYTLNCDLVRWISDNDDDLRDARAYGLVGMAECLWLTGKNDAAVAAAESIDTTLMSIAEKRAASWIRGLSLFSTGRFSEAISQFQAVASDPTYKYSEEACRFLIVCLARSARTDEANDRLDEWIRHYRPSADQVKNVMDRMGIAPVGLSR